MMLRFAVFVRQTSLASAEELATRVAAAIAVPSSFIVFECVMFSLAHSFAHVMVWGVVARSTVHRCLPL